MESYATKIFDTEPESLWSTYKHRRRELGRNQPETAAASSEFIHIKSIYKIYSRVTQVQYEHALISLFNETPNPLPEYLREHKTSFPIVGPLKLSDNTLIHMKTQMTEVLKYAFCFVHTAKVQRGPVKHQKFNGNMDKLHLTNIEEVTIFKALGSSSSAGPNGIHLSVLKHCAEETTIVLITKNVPTCAVDKSEAVTTFRSDS